MNASRAPTLRAEAWENIRLALPLIATQLSFVSMGTVDTIFAGRLGAKPLAAVAVGSNVWFLFFVLFMGLFMSVSPIVAQRVGARQHPAQIGAFVSGALSLGVVMGVVWTIAVRLLGGPVLGLLKLDAETETMAHDYLLALSWGAVPFCLCFVLRNAAEGHGRVKVPLIASLTGLLVNIVFVYLLMYGHGGFPALGAEGCGWATTIAACAMVLIYLLLFPLTPQLRELDTVLMRLRPTLGEAREILRLGLPIAAIVSAEVSLFSIGALMMARFGSETVAAHQIAINFASLSFMVPLSIGLATTVRVGHAAGAGDAVGIALRGRVGIAMSAGYALFAAGIMGLLPGVIVGLYTNVEAVQTKAAAFLLFAAVFQLFDCVQASSNGALRGIKDTRGPMLITVLAYWAVGMPLAIGLAFYTPVGAQGIWWGFIAGLLVAAAGLLQRFLRKTAYA